MPDLAYIANVMTGSHVEWLCPDPNQDFDQDFRQSIGTIGQTVQIREHFAALLPEIEADASEMQNIFT